MSAEDLSRRDAPSLPVETLRALSRPSGWRWAAAALTDWAVIVAVIVAARAVHHPLGYALALLPLGSRQQALGALFHDAAHRLAARDRAVNDLLGNVLCAFPLGLTLGGYRRYHLAHHRHLGTDADPELTHRRALPQWTLPARPVALAHFASDLVGAGVPHLIAAGGLTRPVSLAEAGGLALLWLAGLAAAWRCDALWVPALWVTAIATVFWSGVRLRIWTEHLGTLDTHRIGVGPVMAHGLFPHHIGHHWEHHHFPSVPFWNLDRLRRALPPGLAGAPPIVSLGALARGFADAAPLPSGTVGAVVGRALARPAAGLPAGQLSRWVCGVFAPLALGAAVYLLCRAHPPRALAWLPGRGALVPYGLGPLADQLPDALWAFALTALQRLVWARERSLRAALWTASAPAAVALWELAQRARLVPGTFDPWDLVVSFVACAAAVIAFSDHPGRSP